MSENIKQKKADFYYICLLLLNIEKNKFPHLLGRNRKTIWDRLNKIKTIFELEKEQDIFVFIKHKYLI